MYAFLAEVALKSLLVLLLGFAVALVLRRASAAVRHFAWLVVMFGLFLLPVFSRQMPSYEVTVLARPAARTTPESVSSTGPYGASMPTHAWGAGETAAEVPFGLLLASMWLLGSGAGILGLATALLRVRRRFADAAQAPEAVLALAEDVAAGLGLGQPVSIRQGDVAVPMTIGWARPTVLLPRSLDWPESRLRAVLTHELAHARRRDWPVQLVGEVVCRLYWFNPLAWIAAERMRTESEGAADDAVLRAGATPSEYASDLMTIAQNVPGRQTATVLSIVRASRLPPRLKRILSTTTARHQLGFLPALMLVVAALTTVGALGALRPVLASLASDGGPEAKRTASASETVVLPSGTRVSFLGVVDGTGSGYWTGEGKPMPKSVSDALRRQGYGLKTSLGSTSMQILFEVRSRGSSWGEAPNGTLQVPNGAEVLSSLMDTLLLSEGRALTTGDGVRLSDPCLYGWEVRTSDVPARADLVFGVAEGKWSVAAKLSRSGTDLTYLAGSDLIASLAWERAETSAWPVLRLDLQPPSPLAGNAFVAIPRDAKGNKLSDPQEPSPFMAPLMVSFRFHGGLAKKVAYIEIRTRPYTWIRFKDVHLQSNR